MISILNSGEYYHKLVENKKFIWFIYPKKVHETKVLLRPFFDKENDKFKGENILEEFNNLFPMILLICLSIGHLLDILIL